MSAPHQHFHNEGYARSRYRVEIEELLRRYDDRFVGRSRELARLATFISGRLSGYLLIEAAGGQGKSALIAQLLLRAERGEVPGCRPDVVAFFVRDPGGQRPDDFLSAVNGQLLSLLQRPGGTHYDVRALRNQFSGLWDDARTRATAERPLVLLVDALDEQAGDELTIADLMPESLADHVHVVVSSRPRPDVREHVNTGHPLRQAQVLALGGLESSDVRTLLLGGGLAEGDADRLAARVHAPRGGARPALARRDRRCAGHRAPPRTACARAGGPLPPGTRAAAILSPQSLHDHPRRDWRKGRGRVATKAYGLVRRTRQCCDGAGSALRPRTLRRASGRREPRRGSALAGKRAVASGAPAGISCTHRLRT